MARLGALLLFLVLRANGEVRLSLDTTLLDGTWTVRNQNKSVEIAAKVPGGIYTDLLAAGVLGENLFYRFNDIEYRWVAKDDWTYRTVFDLPAQMASKTAINLVCHGIDTVGEIILNGMILGSVDNMFVRHVIPIKGVVKEKENSLEVRLKSPIRESERLSRIQSESYPVPPECTPGHYNGECHVNFLRKMQASFGWDWGPAFPSVGIWKSVEIEAFDLGIVRDVTATAVKINSTTWQIDATAHVEYADADADPRPPSVVSGVLTAGDATENEVAARAVVRGSSKDASSRVRNGYKTHLLFRVDQSAVENWWPNGFGKQPLYELTVSLEAADRTECSSKTVKIGFRTIEVVQEELRPGKEGLSFYFKINGVPVFAKGSNWIPGHVLPELGSDEATIRNALESARDAHMNMLRVWGGGVYESDAFYAIADELGILIWQDMMFACSMYPTNEEFLESVDIETEQQIRRLQHHPSIALWAGNNENEAALTGNWYGTKKNFTLYKEDYVKLYVSAIRRVIESNDKSRYYAVSSPSNGIESIRQGYVAENPYDPLFGDVHYYNYVFDGWNDYIYPDTRFASEYGFQSMPSFGAMSRVSLPADRNLNSEFTKKRQHLLAGNEFMTTQIQRHLPLPENDGSEEFYKTFIYYSQISQAMSTKTETEKYRRDRSKLTADNKGGTMGAMYWQLNDVWEAPTWSSIEFGGKWKMLHYFAKKFFSPVLVSAERTPTGIIKLFIISDLLEDVPDVRLSVTTYSWNEFKPRKIHSSKVSLNKATSEHCATYKLSDLLEESGCQKQECFLHFTIRGENVFSDNVLYPSSLHEANLKKPNLTAELAPTMNPNEIAVHVTTDSIAPFVWLETEEEGEFSDNGFILLKREVDLVFKGRNNKSVSIDKMKSTLTIRSVL